MNIQDQLLRDLAYNCLVVAVVVQHLRATILLSCWCCAQLPKVSKFKVSIPETHEIKKKNDGKTGTSCFSNSSLIRRFGEDEVGLQGILGGMREASLGRKKEG